MSDLAELMSRDPNKCTREDISEIIKFYRSRHAQWKQTGGSVSLKPLKGKSVETAKQISANDLDL
jgi:hypothetical protein